MKNLLKIVTVITVICMLFTCTTAFAATQTTVTTYNTDTSVNVVSTVNDVASGTMVTYLAAKDANGDSTVQESEIKYIDQQTSDGKPMVFSYSLTAPTGTTWAPSEVVSNVKYGSNDSDVAAALGNDTVKYVGINFTVTGTQNGDEGATLNTTYIGKGETKSVTVTPQDGYEIKSITVDNTPVAEGTYTFDVSYNQEVVVTVEMISGTHVYLYTDATVADGYEIYDTKTDAKLNVVTGIGYYVGGPVEKAYIVFDGCDIDGGHNNYKYEAVVGKDASGYFAVQLADADPSKLKTATKAIVETKDQTVESN